MSLNKLAIRRRGNPLKTSATGGCLVIKPRTLSTVKRRILSRYGLKCGHDTTEIDG